MVPEIYHGIGDFVGDSLQLAIAATRTDADVIVQCGVHFMAETSKILNPAKDGADAGHGGGLFAGRKHHARRHCRDARALSRRAGCHLCQHHGRGEGGIDICCTSSNAAQIIARAGRDTVIMTPDQYLAQNVAREVPEKRIVWWEGSCIVHERNSPRRRSAIPRLEPRHAHHRAPRMPARCGGDESDFSGSTKGILDYVAREARNARCC